jgi:hypothetical protein
MASLQDYVAQQFPQHQIDVWEPGDPPDLELTDHTVVSYAVGTRAGLDLFNTFRRSVPNAHVAAVDVKPTDPTVISTTGEDRDGVVDLPVRRVAAWVVGGFLVFGLLAVALSLVFTDSGVTATSQPRAPGRSITVVAAFLDNDESASSLATSVGPAAGYEVRIVDNKGGWHSPATGNTQP